jgi:hypothetical protein
MSTPGWRSWKSLPDDRGSAVVDRSLEDGASQRGRHDAQEVTLISSKAAWPAP